MIASDLEYSCATIISALLQGQDDGLIDPAA
jgi:hypothetical protein